MPVASRLRMLKGQDRLSLAYNTFFTDLEVGAPSGESLPFRFVISRRGRFEEAQLTLELRLEAGEVLETATGRRITLGAEKIDLAPQDLGGWLRHHGWTLKTDAWARLTWPVYPFNPYADGPETTLENAVAALAVPLAPQASTQTISFTLEAGRMIP
jgi:O-methyltransferase involved in polyketide biosynthesis